MHMNHRDKKKKAAHPQTPAPSASTPKSTIELVPIDPVIRRKVREILKERGFPNYQTT